MKVSLILYFAPLLIFVSWYLARRKQRDRGSRAILEENTRAGLTEPASLHPVIDPRKCRGCGACVSACPEGDVLGIIDGRAELVHATHCIGHGACQQACPFDAITLVFGTEKRGMDIPFIQPNFETNLPGIFIAGELGGMGLIRNAVEQGRQAMESIAGHPGVGENADDCLDVLIVGAGPAGFSATLAAKEQGLNYMTVEQDTLGGTVSHFPRGKLVMTAPVRLPMVGKVSFTETSKEELMEFWSSVEQRTGVDIHYQERLDTIEKDGVGYRVTTSSGDYLTRTVLLAIGRRGTPRKLGVPGEDLPKVVYRLIDAEQYRGRRVVVVGGGDSALEAAVSIAAQEGTSVALSYRSEAFSRAKPKNRDKVAACEADGRLTVYFRSNISEITKEQVVIDVNGETIELPNDDVLIMAGGVLPTPFLQRTGIQVETKHGTA